MKKLLIWLIIISLFFTTLILGFELKDVFLLIVIGYVIYEAETFRETRRKK